MAIRWDTNALPFHSVMFARKNLSRSGGLTFSGIEQVVQSSTDFWEAKVTLKIRRRSQVLAYRSYHAQNWGRAGQWIIPACGGFNEFGMEASWGSDWGSDFQPVSDTDVAAHSVGGTAKLAHSITFHMDDITLTPVAGVYFSIGDRLYLIGTLTASGGGSYTATFAPGLRADAPAGTLITFSNARCTMRLAQDDVGQLDLDMLRFSDVSLSFVEVPF